MLPVIAGLKARLPEKVRISIDTYKAGTARAAVAAGATVVNDVSGGGSIRRSWGWRPRRARRSCSVTCAARRRR